MYISFCIPHKEAIIISCQKWISFCVNQKEAIWFLRFPKLCKPRPQSDLTEYILSFTVTFSWSENSYLLPCRTFINWEEAVVSSKNVLDEITKRWFSKWESAPSTMRETWILESLSWDNLQCRKSSTRKLFFIWVRSKQSPSTWSTIALKLSLYEEQIKLYISLPVLE